MGVRFGRKAVYQLNLRLFGLATLGAALSPNLGWLLIGRFIAGVGLGADGPLCFAYTELPASGEDRAASGAAGYRFLNESPRG